MLKRCLAGVVVALTLVGCNEAGTLEDGLAAYEQGDYKTARQLWLPLAEQGVSDAQFNIGVIYDSGLGLEQDTAEAVKWYRRAAEQGDAEAQTRLGLMYDNGRGVPQDNAEAMKWWRRAAEQNFVSAHNSIGLAHRQQGRLDLAIASYSQAIVINPAYKEAYLNRANAYRDQKRYDLAIANYENAIEIDPEYAAAYNQLAWLLATVQNLEVSDGRRAVEYAEKAAALKPEDPIYVDTLAAAFAKAGRFADAVGMQEKAIELLKTRGENTADFEVRLNLYLRQMPDGAP